MSAGREPIYDADAEAGVLAALLNDATRFDSVPELRATDFYVTANQRIFDAVCAVASKDKRAIVNLVATWLKERDLLQAVGGYPELARLRAFASPSEHVAEMAEVVRDLSKMRVLADSLTKATARIFADRTLRPSTLAASVMNDCAKMLANDRTTMRTLSEIAEERQAQIHAQWAGKRDPWGVSIHRAFPRLNAILMGLTIGGVYVVAGPTGGGKSVIGQQMLIACVAGMHGGEPCGVADFTLEMTGDEVVDRAVCAIAEVDTYELFTGHHQTIDPFTGMRTKGEPLSDEIRVNIDEAFRVLRACNPFEIDTGSQSIRGTLRTSVRRAKARLAARGAKLRVILFDHAGLSDREGRDTAAEIDADFKEFKRICIEEEVAGIILCQYNREQAKDGDAPRMHHLKGASGIEQIATAVLLIDRLDVRETDPHRKAQIRGKSEILIPKLRRGSAAPVPMHFIGEHFTFTEQIPDYIHAVR